MAIQWITDRNESGERWLVAPAGFGYGHNERMQLDDMKGNYRSLFVRHSFAIPDDVPKGAKIVLALRYDDGFVAYLDGREVAHCALEVSRPVDP